MKKAYERLIAILVIVLILGALLTSCSSSKPVDVVDDLLSTVKSGKVDKIDKFIITDDGDPLFTAEDGLIDTDDKKLLKNLFKNYKYEKLKEIELTDEYALVSVEITSADLGVISAQVMTEVTPYAIEHAQDQDKVEKQMKKLMIEKLKDKNAPMHTREVYLELEKVDGKWKVVADGQLTQAIYGGHY